MRPRLVALTVTIDTETTGLGANDRRGARIDGVVQVGIAYRIPKKEVRVWSKLCNPGAKFLALGRADEALAINRLSVPTILEAQPADAVASELRELLATIAEKHGGIELRAYNMGFDRPFLEVPPWRLAHSWGQCLMIEAMEHYGLDRRPRLIDALSIAKVPWEAELHDAGADAHAALLLHEAMCNP